MAEPSRKRTFQARELVWSSFETMARERGAPVDELVNEAMAAYAKARGYVVDRTQDPIVRPPQEPLITEMPHRVLEETQDGRSMSPLDRSYAPADGGFSDDDELARTSARGSVVKPTRDDAYYDTATRTRPRYTAPVPSRGRSGSRLPPPPAPAPAPVEPPWAPKPPPATRPLTPPPPRETREPREVLKRLVLTYEGRAYPVEKDRFLLGRSKTQADLRLDDPNVSRQHAVIERVGAAWFIVDLGSTNGVLIGGERVARRAISEGDTIVITAHEIRCSFR